MKKKLIAVALAGAFAAPAIAAAQGSNVTLYGALKPAVENVRIGNTTAGVSTESRNRVTANQTSLIGVRGTEDLGGGLKAVFQAETNIFPDGSNNTAPSLASAPNAAFGARNTQVGLQGKFGTVFMGNWDTPFKLVLFIREPFGASTLDGSQLLGAGIASNVSTSTGVNAATSFMRRENNTLAYWSPNWNGFEAKIHYAPDEATAVAAGTGVANPSLWSLGATYANGPLYVGLAYERHNEFTGVNQDDTAWGLLARYTFGNTLVGLYYTRLDYETATGSADQRNWQLHLIHAVGAGKIKFAYTKAGDISGSSTTAKGGLITVPGANTGARMWTLGYDHSLSKRTTAKVYYGDLDNSSAAGYAFVSMGAGAVGFDQRVLGLGLEHTF